MGAFIEEWLRPGQIVVEDDDGGLVVAQGCEHLLVRIDAHHEWCARCQSEIISDWR